jgi:hypothetical protein
MPLLCFKPGKDQQQNETAFADLPDDAQYGKKTAKDHI